MKETAVVICPGRGTYNKTELGYIKKYHADKQSFINTVDRYRKDRGQLTVKELDGQTSFQPSMHTTGDNASVLIYACAIADFQDINREKYDIVAITGNSMGWYLALAGAQVLNEEAAVHAVNTMGTLTHHEGKGGQVIYPLVDENWRFDPEQKRMRDAVVAEISAVPGAEVHMSIHLGGMEVFAANHKGVELLLEKLPGLQDRYPFQIPNHVAFHSPILAHIPAEAKAALPKTLFGLPELPLIDGRGHIWQPYATDLEALYDYTFGHQVVRPYDFSKTIEVAIKEFSPDRLVILGPGTTLGAPVAQEMIKHKWQDITSKNDFKQTQKTEPVILCMGTEDQRHRVIRQP